MCLWPRNRSLDDRQRSYERGRENAMLLEGIELYAMSPNSWPKSQNGSFAGASARQRNHRSGSKDRSEAPDTRSNFNCGEWAVTTIEFHFERYEHKLYRLREETTSFASRRSQMKVSKPKKVTLSYQKKGTNQAFLNAFYAVFKRKVWVNHSANSTELFRSTSFDSWERKAGRWHKTNLKLNKPLYGRSQVDDVLQFDQQC